MKNFWVDKKVLVTGGRGFIGAEIVKELIKRGSKVTITTHESIGKIKKLGYTKIIKADLTNYENCLMVTKNIDVVLNFAAMDGGKSFKQKHSIAIFRTNTQIVLNILEAAKINNVDRILIISSIEVYSSKTKSPVKEEYGFDGELDEDKFGYAWSKRIGEIAAKLFSQNGSKIAIARLGNIYGPTDTFDKKRGRVIPTFIDRALKEEDIVISGNGLQKIAFLYITDLVDSLLDLVEKYPVGEPINLVGAECISLKNLASLIVTLSKSKSKIVVSSGSDNKDRIISIVKARKVIGFSPKVNINKGIETILKQYFS